MRDSLLAEKQTLAREIQLANASVDFLNMKVVRVEDQVLLQAFTVAFHLLGHA